MADELNNGPAAVETIGDNDSPNADLDALNKLDEVTPPVVETEVRKKKETKKEDEEVEELKEEEPEEEKEVEEETKEDEDTELASGKTRPAFGKIKAKYPNFFKEFPEVQEALGREKAYTELYPTVEDATEAKEASDDYNFLQEIVAKGTPEGTAEFLGVMKENNPEIYKGYATTFLPALFKEDKETYYAITRPLLDDVIKNVFNEAKRIGNKDLEGSARWFAQYIFGDQQFASGEKVVPKLETKKVEEPSEEKQKINKFWSDRYDETYKDAESRINDKLTKIIGEDLVNEDLSDFEKESIVEKVSKQVQEILSKDSTHMGKMKRMWKEAMNSGFNRKSTDSIISAFLSRARLSIPEIAKEFKAKAKSRTPKPEVIEEKTRKTGGGGGSRSAGRTIPTKPDYSKMSDRDLLDAAKS